MKIVFLAIFLAITLHPLRANTLEVPLNSNVLKQKKSTNSKLKGDLQSLLIEWEYHQQKHMNDNFVSANPRLQITNGFIKVDAVSVSDVKKLETELKKLGMTDISSYGKFVSGNFLVKQLKGATALDQLHSMRLVQVATRNSSKNKGTMASQQIYRNQVQ